MMKSVPWWQSRIAYQIYPRSFCDSNNDGIGDLRGIISKLDYFVELGVGILWLSPVYRSPNFDNGYDISGYREINPEYGTMEDMKELLTEAKKRNLKLIMDLVINHTSDEHPWFVESKKSKDNPYRSFYYWRPGSVDKKGNPVPPNNWSSFFSGPAWEYDRTTQEFYLHLFSKKQPDLNFENPQVLAAVKDIMTFWLDLGIDGFRCDVINLISKTTLANGKKRIALTGREHYITQPGCHKILAELRRDVLSKYDCFTVGETVLVTTQDAQALCPPGRKELDMIFSFDHMDCDHINNKWFKVPFKPYKLMNILFKWQKEVDWNTLYFENHDQPRSISRFGSKKYPQQSAKLLAVILFTLRGTPFIFEGQELGMTNATFNTLSDFRDTESITVWNLATKLHFPRWLKMKLLRATSRDNARTPMQWNTQDNAGFSFDTKTVPWIPVQSNYKEINVETEQNQKDSLLNWYKELITIRKRTPELTGGSFSVIYQDKEVYAYKRSLPGVGKFPDRETYVVLNFGRKKRQIPQEVTAILDALPEKTVLASVYDDTTCLPPYGAFIVKNTDKNL
ncbi:MAG: alpha-glucosidase [Candidatus Treponema excrementipullorum]|nr:alpha-glucosidase [Spirochaetia bacterium]MDD7011351.1 alpha-glucosidase [Candidatus Treponema excrementipullorum]MDY4466878.1 alpha-glucosidase [Candidatus Treponema excrementipullorum]MDY4708412.1 alpha-glucosidase [Candidatus Treponema excrementipullorum]